MNEPKLNNVFEERLTFLISEEEIITCEIEKLEKELDILENKREVFRIQLEELMRIKHKTEKVSQDCAPVIKARPFLAECVPYLVYHPEFTSLRDVHRALDNLESIARETGVLTVAGYYRACNEPVTNVADNEEWGWIGTTIHMGVPVVEYTGTNYRISMPDPMKLGDMELFKHKDIPDDNWRTPPSFTHFVMSTPRMAIEVLQELINHAEVFGMVRLSDYCEMFQTEVTGEEDFWGWTLEQVHEFKIEMIGSVHGWIFPKGEMVTRLSDKHYNEMLTPDTQLLYQVYVITIPECVWLG